MDAKTVALLAGGLLAAGGVGTAIGDLGDDAREKEPSELEIRKDDRGADVELVDDDEGGDGGNDRSKDRDHNNSKDRSQSAAISQDPDTRSWGGTGDTKQTAGTGPSGNTGDGDATAGNDGTGGGDNSYVAPAADAGYVAPAPAAPAYYGGGSDDGGGSDG